MASLNNVITRDPEILGGTPVFRGTRVPFQALLDYLEGGQNLDEFLDDFPTVTREAVIDALEQAKPESNLRMLSESLRLAKEHASAVTLDEDFARDLKAVIDSRRKP